MFTIQCCSHQLVDNAISSQLHPTFFVGRYHTPCLSTDVWFSLLSTILVTQVLVGTMDYIPPIWVHGVGDISVVILSYWILYICMWAPGFFNSTQGLHFFITSLSGLVSSSFSHGPSFCHHDINTEFAFSFFFLSSSSHRRVQSCSGEGRVNE